MWVYGFCYCFRMREKTEVKKLMNQPNHIFLSRSVWGLVVGVGLKNIIVIENKGNLWDVLTNIVKTVCWVSHFRHWGKALLTNTFLSICSLFLFGCLSLLLFGGSWILFSLAWCSSAICWSATTWTASVQTHNNSVKSYSKGSVYRIRCLTLVGRTNRNQLF